MFKFNKIKKHHGLIKYAQTHAQIKVAMFSKIPHITTLSLFNPLIDLLRCP